MQEPFPDHVLCETLWDFADRDIHSCRSTFIEAVRCYHLEAEEYAPEIRAEECWLPEVVVLRSPRVIIRYFSDSMSDDLLWHEIELASDNGESFTAGELLFKLHNAAIGQLRDNGHHYFEGLELDAINPQGMPAYCLRLGS